MGGCIFNVARKPSRRSGRSRAVLIKRAVSRFECRSDSNFGEHMSSVLLTHTHHCSCVGMGVGGSQWCGCKGGGALMNIILEFFLSQIH